MARTEMDSTEQVVAVQRDALGREGDLGTYLDRISRGIVAYMATSNIDKRRDIREDLNEAIDDYQTATVAYELAQTNANTLQRAMELVRDRAAGSPGLRKGTAR